MSAVCVRTKKMPSWRRVLKWTTAVVFTVYFVVLPLCNFLLRFSYDYGDVKYTWNCVPYPFTSLICNERWATPSFPLDKDETYYFVIKNARILDSEGHEVRIHVESDEPVAHWQNDTNVRVTLRRLSDEVPIYSRGSALNAHLMRRYEKGRSAWEIHDQEWDARFTYEDSCVDGDLRPFRPDRFPIETETMNYSRKEDYEFTWFESYMVEVEVVPGNVRLPGVVAYVTFVSLL